MNLEELERTVATSWSPEMLAVYADALQMEGDPRGEIIAIELQPPRPDLEVRRDALMQKWLGFDPRGWGGVRFRYGFVELRSQHLERVLATPAAPFVRSLFVSGTNTEVVQALRTLASAPRPWLTRLSIATGRRFGERRGGRAWFIVEDPIAADLARATPHLEFLDVVGNRVMESFAHPGVSRVRVVGHDAIAALVDAGAPMPAVRELFFAFTQDRNGRVAFSERGLPRTLLARSTLPALASLDVSANELQRMWEHGHVVLFELLAELGVLSQLRLLRVPSVHTDDERAALQHVHGRVPALVVERSDELPAPLHDLLEPATTLGFTLQDHEHRVSMRRLGELMVARWSGFDEDTREAWRDLWQVVARLPTVPDDYYEYRQLPVEAFALATLALPLASLGEAVDDDFALSELATIVARSRETRVSVRRYAW